MDNFSNFDATTWLKHNIYNCGDISLKTTESVSNFTLMWNFFEFIICSNGANIKRFEVYVEKVGNYLSNDDKKDIDRYLLFWIAKYNCSEKTIFIDKFGFRYNDKREVVEKVFNGTLIDTKSKLLVCMLLIYRLRNNLFHGMKAIETLNSQIENLNISSVFISKLINFKQSALKF